jgi:hypothetical protein
VINCTVRPLREEATCWDSRNQFLMCCICRDFPDGLSLGGEGAPQRAAGRIVRAGRAFTAHTGVFRLGHATTLHLELVGPDE